MNIATKTTTHIARAKQYNDKVMQQVCELLNWTEQQYCDHQYRIYEKIVDRLFYEMPKEQQSIRYSPVFRGFFINEWNKRTIVEFLSYAVIADSETCIGADGSLNHQEISDSANDEQEYLFVHHQHKIIGDTTFLTSLNQALDIIFKYNG